MLDEMSCPEKFKVNTFLVIMDQLKNAVCRRIDAYSTVVQRFGIVTEYDSMSAEDINAATSALVNVYPHDLSPNFPMEFRQCLCWVKEQVHPDDATGSAQSIFKLLHTTGVHSAFPDSEIALRMYLSLMSTNCTGKRSFSQLERIKDVKRSTMSQQRLGMLALLSIESDLLHNVDIHKVVDEFAVAKARKVAI